MDYFTSILGFLNDKEFVVPVPQVALLIAINSFCLLLGKHKLGLLLSYGFVFYWGFIFNRPYFVTALGETMVGMYVYAVMGLFMLVVAAYGFLRPSE